MATFVWSSLGWDRTVSRAMQPLDRHQSSQLTRLVVVDMNVSHHSLWSSAPPSLSALARLSECGGSCNGFINRDQCGTPVHGSRGSADLDLSQLIDLPLIENQSQSFSLSRHECLLLRLRFRIA
ncbi:unnamed protein product [Boreogadus saida]